MRSWADAVDEFVNYQAEKEVGDGGCDDDHVLDGLFDVYSIEVIGTGCFDGGISEGFHEVGVAVALHDGGAAGCSGSRRGVRGDVEAIAVAGVGGDVDAADTDDAAAQG